MSNIVLSLDCCISATALTSIQAIGPVSLTCESKKSCLLVQLTTILMGPNGPRFAVLCAALTMHHAKFHQKNGALISSPGRLILRRRLVSIDEQEAMWKYRQDNNAPVSRDIDQGSPASSGEPEYYVHLTVSGTPSVPKLINYVYAPVKI